MNVVCLYTLYCMKACHDFFFFLEIFPFQLLIKSSLAWWAEMSLTSLKKLEKESWALALYIQVRSPLSAHLISMDRYRSSAHMANF